MFNFLLEPFMIYALLIGIFLALSGALLSPFLVLSDQAMISDGLSHVAFSGIIFGLLFLDEPIYFAIPFAIASSVLITYLKDQKFMNNDAAIGVVSSLMLAIGLITVSISSGYNRSIESLLTGSILSSSISEVLITLVVLMFIASFVLVFYRKLISTTFDNTFAKVSNVKTTFIKYSLAILTAIFVGVGVRTVGMLLISAFIIFPTLISMQNSKSFKSTLLISLISVIVIVFASVTFSYHLDIPTGSSIVVGYTIALLVSITIKKIKSR